MSSVADLKAKLSQILSDLNKEVNKDKRSNEVLKGKLKEIESKVNLTAGDAMKGTAPQKEEMKTLTQQIVELLDDPVVVQAASSLYQQHFAQLHAWLEQARNVSLSIRESPYKVRAKERSESPE